jgi:hypothetical protein
MVSFTIRPKQEKKKFGIETLNFGPSIRRDIQKDNAVYLFLWIILILMVRFRIN